jgi:hypothetical protein
MTPNAKIADAGNYSTTGQEPVDAGVDQDEHQRCESRPQGGSSFPTVKSGADTDRGEIGEDSCSGEFTEAQNEGRWTASVSGQPPQDPYRTTYASS